MFPLAGQIMSAAAEDGRLVAAQQDIFPGTGTPERSNHQRLNALVIVKVPPMGDRRDLQSSTLQLLGANSDWTKGSAVLAVPYCRA